MRSLALKLIIAFLVVSLVGTAFMALLAGRTTANEFGQFVFSRNQEMLADSLADYYQSQGSWLGVESIIPPGRSGPGRGMGMGGAFGLADASGVVIVPGIGYHHGDKLSRSVLDSGLPIEVGGRTVGVMLPSGGQFRPNVTEDAFLARVNLWLVVAALGATAVALLLGALLARALTRPIQELKAATQTVAQGNLGHQVEVRSRDELGELATSFNQMSADLAKARDLRRQMTADIAHDLRTPLSVILSHAEALQDGVLPADQETFHVIHDEAMRLSRLVEDLRTLTRAEADELPLTRRLTSPGQLLERAAAALKTRAQQGEIKLNVSPLPDLPDLDVDPDRMAQVLNNLLENAIRHTPRGGTVSLAAEPAENGVRLSVRDSGPGIAPEDLSRIFDRFYRADKSRQRHDGGSGLGLAIARSLVERHGGRIWAESAPGQGAAFFIKLPVR